MTATDLPPGAQEELSLGRNVWAKHDGLRESRYYFVAPHAGQSIGWPPIIHLPETGVLGWRNLPVDLRLERIRADALRLNKQLDRRLELRSTYVSDERRDLPNLANLVKRTRWYRGRVLSMQNDISRYMRNIVRWSEAREHPLFDSFVKEDVEDCIDGFDGHPATQRKIHSAWRRMGLEAKSARWITGLPTEGIPWNYDEPKFVEPHLLWDRERVELYCYHALRLGQPGLALLIWLGYETGARLG